MDELKPCYTVIIDHENLTSEKAEKLACDKFKENYGHLYCDIAMQYGDREITYARYKIKDFINTRATEGESIRSMSQFKEKYFPEDKENRDLQPKNMFDSQPLTTEREGEKESLYRESVSLIMDGEEEGK